MIIKVCGISNEQLKDIDGLGIDLVGRIFHSDSPRDMSMQSPIESETPQIGVFVDRTTIEVMTAVDTYGLSGIQLHGKEEAAQISEMKRKGLTIIKAISIADVLPTSDIQEYGKYCDIILLDTKGMRAGGNGKRFNWSLLEDYTSERPFLLSGGIGPVNVEEILAIDHPLFAGVDVNSGFESRPGYKDIDSLKTFINALRHHG